MKSQKNILSFFKPVDIKRNISLLNDSDDVISKKKKTEILPLASDKLISMSSSLPILDTGMGPSWFLSLQNEFSKPYFKGLNDFVCQERKTQMIYPEPEDVWAWTKLCPLEDVKVVILGQDPYHNPGQAHGLCFSVVRGVPPPPSLLNIYKELTTDITGFRSPGHGDLTKWAKQGVLLLNACLTVRKNSPNSHANKGWEKITDAVIKAISDNNQGVVFLLWGAFAQKKAGNVDKNKHHLLKAVHPSPLSAMRGFFGCKHFSKCNELLMAGGKTPIDWRLH